MWFVVKFRSGKSPKITTFPHVVLTQDNWDDYGYQTTFDVTLHLGSDEEIDLGNVKILRRDQKGGYTEMPRKPFEELGDLYCSLGADLDYYEELYTRGRNFYRPFLRGLRDVVYDDDVRAEFEDKEGYKVSLLRFHSAERTIDDAVKLFARNRAVPVQRSKGFAAKFRTRVASNTDAFIIDFDFRRRNLLPHRINVVIGYNGTGKTQLLSNLAIVTSGYGYARKEDLLAKAAGRFVGTIPPFKKVVVISYSAFDTFVIPGRTAVEKRRIREEGEIFGYVYCGLRERSEEEDDEEEDGGNPYRLLTPQETEEGFLSSLLKIRELDRLETLLEVLKLLLEDPSFQRIGLTQIYSEDIDASTAELFRRLSSGHKVVLKIIVELIAYIDDSKPTLVLIDEPETHLHPPLLAALLKSVRVCLDKFDGYAVIATHSPVVLQETPSRYVRILRRYGDKSRISVPNIETFGESISVITQDVFNLDDGSTDWHDTLGRMARNASLADIEAMFGQKLGFAARSYVLSRQEDEEE